MAALQCELCGGKLMGKAGGIFECEICGMQYTSDWARAKLQEGGAPAPAPVSAPAPSAPAKQDDKKEKFMAEAKAFCDRVAPVRHLIAGGDTWSVRLNLDGTVTVMGTDDDGDPLHLDVVNEWTDIVAVTTGGYLVAGLKADGTVVCADVRWEDDPDVSEWTDIVDISCGSSHIIGLKSDGTVVAAGDGDPYDDEDPCGVHGWRDIVAISTSTYHTVGVKRDGSVLCAGTDEMFGMRTGHCNVSGWRDIVTVAVSSGHTVGLKSDGTVVAVGIGAAGQCNVSGWRDIVAIDAGTAHTLGLKADGTVVATGGADGQSEVYGWSDVVSVHAGGTHTLALRSDGTVLAAGYNNNGRCDVEDWKLFEYMDDLEQERVGAKEALRVRREEEARLAEERRIAREKAEAERKAKRKTALITERATLQTELANLKGLFSGKRRKEIEARMAAIEQELKGLN